MDHDTEHKDVSRNDVWDELGKQRTDITEVKSGLASLDSKMDSIMTFIQNNRPQPTNMLALGSLIVSIIVACAMWVNHTNKPQDDNIDTMNDRIDMLVELKLEAMRDGKEEASKDAYAHGKMEGQFEMLKERLDLVVEQQLVDVEERGRNNQFDSAVYRWLEKVDSLGPRVWVNRDTAIINPPRDN